MTLWHEIRYLIGKELRLEWRNRYALNGILLYVLLMVFIVFLSFQQVEPKVWNALLWIILLFTAVNGIAKSFLGESRARDLYYYSLASPQAIILSKILYSTLLMLAIAAVAVAAYAYILGFPVLNPLPYFATLLLGTIGFAATFTMVAGIASRADNSAPLMAILSLPLFLPMLVLLLHASEAGFRPVAEAIVWRNTAVLLGIDGIVAALALVLFPYLWHD